jgi:hypothetical protein
MSRRRRIALVSPSPATSGPPAPPPDRGVLLTAQKIVERFFTVDGERLASKKWVLANAPADRIVQVGKSYCWYELDVREWLEQMRKAS